MLARHNYAGRGPSLEGSNTSLPLRQIQIFDIWISWKDLIIGETSLTPYLGLGADTLTGGGGSDNFKFTESGATNTGTVITE